MLLAEFCQLFLELGACLRFVSIDFYLVQEHSSLNIPISAASVITVSRHRVALRISCSFFSTR